MFCKSDIYIKQRYTLNITQRQRKRTIAKSAIQQSQENCMQKPTVS